MMVTFIFFLRVKLIILLIHILHFKFLNLHFEIIFINYLKSIIISLNFIKKIILFC